MSDTSQGPGWWVASDGKWYPPELHPSQPAPSPEPEPEPEEAVEQPARSDDVRTRDRLRTAQVVVGTLVAAVAVALVVAAFAGGDGESIGDTIRDPAGRVSQTTVAGRDRSTSTTRAGAGGTTVTAAVGETTVAGDPSAASTTAPPTAGGDGAPPPAAGDGGGTTTTLAAAPQGIDGGVSPGGTTTTTPADATVPPTDDGSDTQLSPEVVDQICSALRSAGLGPLRRGESGYSSDLDPDGDGVACG
jgi:hypothetical protein